MKPSRNNGASSSSSNSKLAVKPSLRRFPRKPSPALVYLEECFRGKYKGQETITEVLKNFSDNWKSMTEAEMERYVTESKRRDLAYEKHVVEHGEARAKWTALPEPERKRYIEKAKAPYNDRIHEIRKSEPYDDQNVNKYFEAIAFIGFSEESQIVQDSVDFYLNPIYVFIKSLTVEHKRQHPEDTKFHAVDLTQDRWWESVPSAFLEQSQLRWISLTDEQQKPYITQWEEIQAEAMQDFAAFAFFRNKYIGTYKLAHPEDNSFDGMEISPNGWWPTWPPHVAEAAEKAWESKSAEQKAVYLEKANTVMQFME